MVAKMQQNDILARTKHLSSNAGCHKHLHHQIIIGMKGEANFEVEGLGGKVDEYSGCIVPSNESHSFYGDHDNDMFILDISPDINPAENSNFNSDIYYRLFESRRYFAVDQQMHLTLLSLAKELRMCDYDASMQPLVAELALRSLYNRLVVKKDSDTQRLHGDRLDLNIVQQYIHAHIEEKIQVSELAKACDLSVSYFYQKFREKMGVSPHQYLIYERIKVAKFLLNSTNKTLTDICFSLGFSSQSAFTNTFTKNVGCSPSLYRHNNR
ncbi:MAG: AraC family transcriptional regulator [Cellvibrionaceae bacterium]